MYGKVIDVIYQDDTVIIVFESGWSIIVTYTPLSENVWDSRLESLSRLVGYSVMDMRIKERETYMYGIPPLPFYMLDVYCDRGTQRWYNVHCTGMNTRIEMEMCVYKKVITEYTNELDLSPHTRAIFQGF
jgi:hypothetical protein